MAAPPEAPEAATALEKPSSAEIASTTTFRLAFTSSARTQAWVSLVITVMAAAAPMPTAPAPKPPAMTSTSVSSLAETRTLPPAFTSA